MSLQAYNKKSVDLSSVFKEVLMKMAETTKKRLSTTGKEKKIMSKQIHTVVPNCFISGMHENEGN